ncbi:MAG: TerB family tellurite resistance protein [Fidelibacterota bacterium]
MSVRKKILWGSLGWVLGGPIGAIIGFSLAQMSEAQGGSGVRGYSGFQSRSYPKTQAGDFIVSLLVLFAAVMKADRELKRSELEYVKRFLLKQFSQLQVQDFMILFKDILKQDYPLRDVCRQIQRSMDHPSRLELIHVLFGLSQADGYVHKNEIDIIQTIARYLNINQQDFDSIKAMFVKDSRAAYKILGVERDTADQDIKKAYRRMASKYHPDKVSHLGEDLRQLAEEKFKSVNEAFQTIKKERGFA